MAYSIVRKEPLDRLQGTYIELVHEGTGARHVHIQCPDDNNAFALFFPTVPSDSTGVAHILEHVVLAGSKRYPVRDPFFSMTRRSLATFMNAFTSSDSTIYLFSTRNAKDYRNLIEVYLDASFFPNLSEESFKQEGIRLEFEDPADESSGLRFKGVVFNEMKGAMSSPQSIMADTLGRALFPGVTYENNSGGDPAAIPDLTWQNLRKFHAYHYHPTNARFFTYGDQPLERTLKLIEEQVLSHFERLGSTVSIPLVKRFEMPQKLEAPYPATKGEDHSRKSQALLAWVTVPSADSYRVLAMKVLSDVLFDNAGSPLRKALIDSHLGTALADGTGFRDDSQEAVFAAGLKDIAAEDAPKVEQLVLDTLERLAKEGLDEAQVAATIHSLEFEKRERSNAGFPYALKVLFTCLAGYYYGDDAYRALNFEADLEKLNSERSRGGFFEDLIKSELLQNSHRSMITLKPDTDLEDRQREQELERLATIEAKLSAGDKKKIVEEARSLKESQDAAPDLTSLPTLEISDIPMKFEKVPSRDEPIGPSTAQFYPLPTNGVTYIDLRTDFSSLKPELKDLLPLFTRVLTQMGAAGMDYAQMATRIAGSTGGVNAYLQIQPLAATDDYLQWLVLSGKALDRNAEPFVEILTDLTAKLEIDPHRLKDIIAEYSTRLEGSVASAGYQYASLAAQSKLSSDGALKERLQGIAQIELMREIAKLDESKLPELIEKLDAIRTQLFRSHALLATVTCEDAMVSNLQPLLAAMSSALPVGVSNGHVARPKPRKQETEARTGPMAVAYNVRVFKTVRYTHPDAPALLVLSNYMRDVFIHKELREKGGAYGGYVSAAIDQGAFVLGSYRDPNIVRTYDVYDEAILWASTGEVDPERLKEAILGSCGDVDPLESPDIKGRREAQNRMAGYSLEEREVFKRRLLGVTANDLRRVASTYLAKGISVQATVAGPDLVEAARKERASLFEVVAPI